MRSSLLVLVFVLACGPAAGDAQRTDEAVIAYAKDIDVARLDTEISSGRLEDWLTARTDKIQWTVSDCDLKAARHEPPARRPLCVKIAFTRGEVSGWAMVTVGTVAQGPSGSPVFEYAVVTRPAELRAGKIKTVLRLSELGQALKGNQ